MIKFSEMQYTRPDFNRVYTDMKALLEKMEKAETAEALFAAMEALDTAGRHFQTQQQLSYIRYTINTKDAFYSAEKDMFDEETPRFAEIPAEAAGIILESRFRGSGSRKYGSTCWKNMK